MTDNNWTIQSAQKPTIFSGLREKSSCHVLPRDPSTVLANFYIEAFESIPGQTTGTCYRLQHHSSDSLSKSLDEPLNTLFLNGL
jgi:hypothetical protein